MLGYAEKIKDLDKKNANKKKLFTGDLAKKDKDGFYYITGRKTRYLKMFGLRVSLDEIEQQIKVKGIIDCACLGKDDNLIIFITNANKKEYLVKYFAQNLGIKPSNILIRVVSQIPRNQNGKVLYSNLKS